MEGALARLCSWPNRDYSPRHCRMAGAEVLLDSQHKSYRVLPQGEGWYWVWDGDRDGDVAKEVGASQRSRGLPNRMSE